MIPYGHRYDGNETGKQTKTADAVKARARREWMGEAVSDAADHADLTQEARAEDVIEDEIAFADPGAWS